MASIISDRIRFAREAAGMKANELAKLLGISPSRLSNWENGTNRPQADRVAEIAKVLNIDANYLLGLSEKLSARINDGETAEELLETLKNSPDIRMVAKISGTLTDEGKRDLLRYAELLKNQRDSGSEE